MRDAKLHAASERILHDDFGIDIFGSRVELERIFIEGVSPLLFAKYYSAPSKPNSSSSSNTLFLAKGYQHHQLIECLHFLDQFVDDDVLALLEPMHDAI